MRYEFHNLNPKLDKDLELQDGCAVGDHTFVAGVVRPPFGLSKAKKARAHHPPPSCASSTCLAVLFNTPKPQSHIRAEVYSFIQSRHFKLNMNHFPEAWGRVSAP